MTSLAQRSGRLSDEPLRAARLAGIVRDSTRPLIGRGPGNDDHHRLALAQVMGAVGHARFDEDKISRAVYQRRLQAGTEAMLEPPLQHVEPNLVAVMNMGLD